MRLCLVKGETSRRRPSSNSRQPKSEAKRLKQVEGKNCKRSSRERSLRKPLRKQSRRSLQNSDSETKDFFPFGRIGSVDQKISSRYWAEGRRGGRSNKSPKLSRRTTARPAKATSFCYGSLRIELRKRRQPSSLAKTSAVDRLCRASSLQSAEANLSLASRKELGKNRLRPCVFRRRAKR